jgi:hypothetical protein
MGGLQHAPQNDERSAGGGLVQRGKKSLMAGAARRKREPSKLGGLTFQTVLVDSQTSDFRFKRLPRNPQFGSRA